MTYELEVLWQEFAEEEKKKKDKIKENKEKKKVVISKSIYCDCLSSSVKKVWMIVTQYDYCVGCRKEKK